MPQQLLGLGGERPACGNFQVRSPPPIFQTAESPSASCFATCQRMSGAINTYKGTLNAVQPVIRRGSPLFSADEFVAKIP